VVIRKFDRFGLGVEDHIATEPLNAFKACVGRSF
jgi:hypothetical protein